MPFDVEATLAHLESHAAATGRFERVNKHEPKNAPGSGLTAAIWLQNLRAVPASGLAATSGRVEFRVRLYSNMLQEPQDAIDPALLSAAVQLLGAYSGDFELGGNVRNVDLLGQAGDPLGLAAGYLNQDGRMMRVLDVTVPLIVNDIWEQSP